MRETIVVAFGAGGIGAALGALLVLGLHTPAAPPAPPALDERALAAAFERAFAKGVADLRRDVAGLRDALASPRSPEPPGAVEPAAQGRRRATAGDAADASHEAAVRRAVATTDPRRDSPFDAPNPAANFERLRALADWDEVPETKKTWLFADEATCLAWFGTPDDVSPNGEAEVWCYNEPMPDADGDGESDGTYQYTFQFNRGRVYRIDVPREQR